MINLVNTSERTLTDLSYDHIIIIEGSNFTYNEVFGRNAEFMINREFF